MRIAVVGHSLTHVRQQNFFREVAKLGHTVALFCPSHWNNRNVIPYVTDDFSVVPLDGMSRAEDVTDIYNIFLFTLIGLEKALEKFDPDWLYVQQEPGSLLLEQCEELGGRFRHRMAVFTWENIKFRGGEDLLKEADLVVCGNDAAYKLVEAAVGPGQQWPKLVIMPQVGVDTEHMAVREQVKRTIDVAYVGRPDASKGLDILKQAYPLTKVLPWTEYLQLPWFYSQVKVIVCYSQDTPYWREQAMPYVALEAEACGSATIVSDAGSIPFWHTEYAGVNPGVHIIQRARLFKEVGAEAPITALRDLIYYLIKGMDDGTMDEHIASGRQWIVDNLSSPVIAGKLVEAMEGIYDGRTST